MPWTTEEKYFASLLIWTQNHSKLSQIDNTHQYDNDLLLRQESQKSLCLPEVDIITIKRTMILCLYMHFILDVFQITAIEHI